MSSCLICLILNFIFIQHFLLCWTDIVQINYKMLSSLIIEHMLICASQNNNCMITLFISTCDSQSCTRETAAPFKVSCCEPEAILSWVALCQVTDSQSGASCFCVQDLNTIPRVRLGGAQPKFTTSRNEPEFRCDCRITVIKAWNVHWWAFKGTDVFVSVRHSVAGVTTDTWNMKYVTMLSQ